MEPASPLPKLPFGKDLRKGQKRVLKTLPGRKQLNVKLPTGYGKTYTGATVYSTLKAAGKVNRLLAIFPTGNQIKQFVKDGPSDLKCACVDGPLSIYDMRFFTTEALKQHKNNKVQIFATTIQSLIKDKGLSLVGELMRTGLWMTLVDEYHHYGEHKTWGRTVLGMHHEFLLAMSATPYRPEDDSAFGSPDITVTYRQAVEEGAVKPLRGHAYHYLIDAIMKDGSVRSYTTAELADEVRKEIGDDKPEDIEKFLIRKEVRWSPKYVSPLVEIPIERMLRERMYTSGGFLQVIIGAMCVSHAKLICEQIKKMFPELRIDWVGTGKDGRSTAENEHIIEKLFCPEKDVRGNRHPTLDVLVHVGLAGEGLDCIHVSEVVHLNQANVNNSNNQENGRSARKLENVIGNISYDSSSGYARGGYVGDRIELAMDEVVINQDDVEQKTPKDILNDLPTLPDEPYIRIFDVELDRIDSGDPDVKVYEQAAVATGRMPFTMEDLKDKNHPCHTVILESYKNYRRREAAENNSQSIVEQWKKKVGEAVTATASQAVRILYNYRRVDSTTFGDVKKRINTRKKHVCGELVPNLEVCKKHWKWLVDLDREIHNSKKVPEWLQ